MNYKKLLGLVSIALMLTVFIGCGRVELLQNDNIESYKFLDHQALAPGMSLQEALDTLQNPPANNPAKLSEAISTVMAAMGLTTSSTGDPYQTYSIDGMVTALETTLKNSGLNFSGTTLKSIIIGAINETINQVNSGSLDHTKPENAGLIALAEGIQQRTGKTVITNEDASNPNLLDTAGFLVLTTAINQSFNSKADGLVRDISERAIQQTVDKVNSVVPGALTSDIAMQLLEPPGSKPLLGGLLTSVVRDQLTRPEVGLEVESVLSSQIKAGDLSDAIEERITSQVAAEMTTILKQMQDEGQLQGVTIPDSINFDDLDDLMSQVNDQVNDNDWDDIVQQVSTIQDNVVKEIETNVANDIKNSGQSSQTNVKDFVEAIAKETGTTIVVEPIVPPHNQGTVIIQ